LCAVAVVEAIEQTTGLASRIKWPNDVMIGARKVCGILTEVLSREGQAITVVGIGLNVNLDPAAAGLPATGTSLSAEAGQPVDRGAALGALLERLDRYLEWDDQTLTTEVRRRWETMLWRRAQAVRVEQDGSNLYGVIEGLTPAGELRLRTPDGDLVEVAVGDVSQI
jgi:BirA family transcriptional regulator, biotin operon repressor / biotin---[acetyl-CoA-carboxylase] ligase